MSFEETLLVDEYCAFCGADDQTDERFVSGFLAVTIITAEGKAAAKRICSACLAMVLDTAMQRASLNSGGSGLANAAIEDQQQNG